MRSALLCLLLALVACSQSSEPAKNPDSPVGQPAPAAPAKSEEVGTSGKLPPEKIQAVVRANVDAFRRCYDAGAARNPKLAGEVSVRFVIAKDGSVSLAELEKSTLADEEATSCIVDTYRSLKFPQPEGGVVTVVYPMQFSP